MIYTKTYAIWENRFDWTPIETLRQILKLGLLALQFYKTGEGGIYFVDDLDMPIYVELNDVDEHKDDLDPFQSFIDKLDF